MQQLVTRRVSEGITLSLAYASGYPKCPISKTDSPWPQRWSVLKRLRIYATTILLACGIEPPSEMEGLDLRDPKQLQRRDRVFVDVYEHDSNLDEIEDLDSGLKARVVIDGWDKLIAKPGGNELYDLKTDTDDRTNLASTNPQKIAELSAMIDGLLEGSGLVAESK